MQPLQHIFQPLKIRISSFDCLAEDGSVDVVGHIGLFEHAALSLLELCQCGLWILGGVEGGGCLWLAFYFLQKDLVCALVVDLLEDLWSTLHYAFVLICLQKVFDNGVLFYIGPVLFLFFLFLPLLVAFLELSLKLPHCLFELGQWPILKIVSAFFGGGEVFLKLLWIVIFLDDFLEEVLLLFLLV